MRILIAEDETATARALKLLLEKSMYSVDIVHTGTDAWDYIQAGSYDVIVLDIMMPGMSGLDVLRHIRSSHIATPVLMLTAKAEIEDRVLGLDSGANDYLPKPFDSRELLARVRSITRSRPETDAKLSFGNVTLDRATFELSTPTGSFRLANKEYQMMEYLMINPRRVISPEMFMEKIWGYDSEAEINVVWVYISYLRKKLAALKASVQIKSSRNAGYSLEDGNDK